MQPLVIANPQDLPEGTFWSKGFVTHHASSTSGEGAYKFDCVSFGFVLRRLESYTAKYEDSRRLRQSLDPFTGWLLPPGVEAQCDWNQPNDYLTTLLEARFLASVVEDGEVPDFNLKVQLFDPLLVQLAVKLHLLSQPGLCGQALYRDSIAVAFAAQLVHQHAKVTAIPPPVVDRRIHRAQCYLMEHQAEPVDLETLAGVAGMSPFHFLRSFKRAYGLPPHRYLHFLRMERAKSLILSRTDLAVSEIAGDVGFTNTSHFSRAFRNHVGMTPGLFRKQH